MYGNKAKSKVETGLQEACGVAINIRMYAAPNNITCHMNIALSTSYLGFGVRDGRIWTKERKGKMLQPEKEN